MANEEQAGDLYAADAGAGARHVVAAERKRRQPAGTTINGLADDEVGISGAAVLLTIPDQDHGFEHGTSTRRAAASSRTSTALA